MDHAQASGEPPANPEKSFHSKAGPEETVFKIKPTLRPSIIFLTIAMALVVGLNIYTISIAQAIVDATIALYAWTDSSAWKLTLFIRVVGVVPVLVIVLGMLIKITTIYELTTHRLRIHHGILIRRSDEIGLHRVRDFIMIRTLVDMIIGTGRIKLHTRDPVFPTFLSAPLINTKTYVGVIRKAAYDYMNKTGYREFESW